MRITLLLLLFFSLNGMESSQRAHEWSSFSLAALSSVICITMLVISHKLTPQKLTKKTTKPR
jgi:hypothetical protein